MLGKASSTLRRVLLQAFLMLLVFVGSMRGQTAAARTAQPQAKDPIDVKLQEALRARDAIIRNLLGAGIRVGAEIGRGGNAPGDG